MLHVRRVRDDERAVVLEIVAEAAQAYRGVIPDDRWHEPYMSADELDREVADGVELWGVDDDGGVLLGVMGVQDRGEVALVRHAYVRTAAQGRGVGGALLSHLRASTDQPLLVGTWAAATWAVRFYERHGFVLVTPSRAAELLRRWWSVPERQIETSVVLESVPR